MGFLRDLGLFGLGGRRDACRGRPGYCGPVRMSSSDGADGMASGWLSVLLFSNQSPRSDGRRSSLGMLCGRRRGRRGRRWSHRRGRRRGHGRSCWCMSCTKRPTLATARIAFRHRACPCSAILMLVLQPFFHFSQTKVWRSVNRAYLPGGTVPCRDASETFALANHPLLETTNLPDTLPRCCIALLELGELRCEEFCVECGCARGEEDLERDEYDSRPGRGRSDAP